MYHHLTAFQVVCGSNRRLITDTNINVHGACTVSSENNHVPSLPVLSIFQPHTVMMSVSQSGVSVDST